MKKNIYKIMLSQSEKNSFDKLLDGKKLDKKTVS